MSEICSKLTVKTLEHCVKFVQSKVNSKDTRTRSEISSKLTVTVRHKNKMWNKQIKTKYEKYSNKSSQRYDTLFLFSYQN